MLQTIESTAEQTGMLVEYGRQYIESKFDETKLDIAEKSAKVTAKVGTNLIMGFMGMLSFLFLMCALVFTLNIWLESLAISFAIVSVVNAMLGFLMYQFRNRILVNPILQSVIDIMFDDEE